ncbi:MAG TPA: sodium:solute symporter family protein [Acidimicrobiia bacterium]|nr:sodium:solute symporter family protein [Acidimicrobiia bacterium]
MIDPVLAVSAIKGWTLFFVVTTFSLYVYIAWRSRVSTTSGLYVADQGIPAVANGMAIGADWMSAASFISMAGLISFLGFDGAIYLLGWTGGYVLLALLLAPYLRKYGKYTIPDLMGDRYSDTARLVAVFAAIFVSFTYVAGQMRGVGIVFSRYIGISIEAGVVIGMLVVLFYATVGGMKGITWTQVAQYTVLIIAYLIPAFAIAGKLADIPIPQVSFGSVAKELNALQEQFGLSNYTEPFTNRPIQDVFLVTMALMVGTAGLPHILVRFYTTKSVRAARYSAGWALVFIAALYTTAPAVAVFAKTNLLDQMANKSYEDRPDWVRNWEETGLISFVDENGNGQVDSLTSARAKVPGELEVSPDIMVLANPEIAGLPAPVIGLVAAGGLAAALSTASGLLLVIGSAVGHDLYYKRLRPNATEKQRVMAGRVAIAGGVLVAGYFGVNPPGFVAQVVAFAFGLAASSFFPAITLGIFWKRANSAGMISGLVTGMGFSAWYMYMTLYGDMTPWWKISPEGIGAIGMVINFVVTIIVSKMTAPPRQEIQDLIEEVRHPRLTSEATSV